MDVADDNRQCRASLIILAEYVWDTQDEGHWSGGMRSLQVVWVSYFSWVMGIAILGNWSGMALIELVPRYGGYYA